MSDGATEIALNPDGKEIAFVAHGEVFVTSTEHGGHQAHHQHADPGT